jgi:hypothetical protein
VKTELFHLSLDSQPCLNVTWGEGSMDGERSFAETLLSGGIILVVQFWVWFYRVQCVKDVGMKARKLNSQYPNRLYVIA